MVGWPAVRLRAESLDARARTALDAPAHTAVAAAAGGPRLTETQRALWFIQRSDPRSYAYNITRAFTLTADVDRLTRAQRRRRPARLTAAESP
ncbi:hypothetical protein ACFXOM_08985 [Streptomyces sp. NPDC059169]|uniref:hypothetical protein n=1 Tax=unclassified Streptomyces TaxID=2593676 RepID=UPI00369A32F8